jgi:hypothetical protein
MSFALRSLQEPENDFVTLAQLQRTHTLRPQKGILTPAKLTLLDTSDCNAETVPLPRMALKYEIHMVGQNRFTLLAVTVSLKIPWYTIT